MKRVCAIAIFGFAWAGLGGATETLPARVALPPPTWARDVAPILYQNCVECHQPGEVGPFPLLTYEDAAKRARFLAKTVRARRMPPWLPDGPSGAFLDERHLTDQEIAVMVGWAEAGAPAGDRSQAPVIPPKPGTGWRLGPPDLIVRMKQPFITPAGPDDVYEVFPVPYSVGGVAAEVLASARIPESEVLGVAAVDIRPGNSRAFHHADVWVDLSGVARKRERAEGGNGFKSFGTPGFPPAADLGGRVPGMTPRFLPPGIASSVLPLQGDLVFHIHYRATGKPETDQSEIGIYFTHEPVKRIINSLLLRRFRLDIPAGESRYVIEDSIVVPADCLLMNILPHMHLIAQEVHASVVNPDGSTQPLLDISRWNFKWQDRYVYREPILLSKGATIRCRWVFDNSAANPANPFSPPQRIRFGPNATDEMCALRLGVIAVNLAEDPLFATAREKKLRAEIAEMSTEERDRLNWAEAVDETSAQN
jgi:mono/diheme cytochrome c family protein